MKALLDTAARSHHAFKMSVFELAQLALHIIVTVKRGIVNKKTQTIAHQKLRSTSVFGSPHPLLAYPDTCGGQ